MTAMMETTSSQTARAAKPAAHALADAAAEAILCRFGERKDLEIDPVSNEEVRVHVPVRFPDGVGAGKVLAHIFAFNGERRVDVFLTHNRTLADRNGNPTSRECYLNDFTASRTFELTATELPQVYITKTVNGIRAALTAVERHNKLIGTGWGRIEVAAAKG